MIEGTSSSEKYFYHYTKASVAIDYILKNQTLRLGSYQQTNDPKESSSWKFDQGTNGNGDLSKHSNTELSTWLSGELKEKTKLLCFSMDRSSLTGNHLQDIFNRGFSKPRMWAQYGDKHQGVCLVFDRVKIDKLIKEQFESNYHVLCGEIEYRNRSVIPDLFSPADQQYMINVDHLAEVGKDQYVQDHIFSHYKRLFLEKMEDWRDEDEFRYVIFSNTKKDLYVRIEDAISGVMFGEYTSDKSVKKIIHLTKNSGTRYMGLKWKNCSPWYDYANTRYRS